MADAGSKGFVSEFKEFIATGNMVDLAVGVILGAAVGVSIKAFTDGIMMQLVAAIFGQPDFNDIKITLRKNVGTKLAADGKTKIPADATLQIGAFINTLISLLLTGLVLFMIVKGYNGMRRRRAVETAVEAPVLPTEIELLTEIRDALRTRS